MDDHTPVDPAKATAQAQMDDQTLTDTARAVAQPPMDDRVPADPSKVTAQVEVDDLEHAFGSQMAIASANVDEPASVQRLQTPRTKEPSYSAPHIRTDANRLAYVKHMLKSEFPVEMQSCVLETAIRCERLR